ncbi:acyltransferase family protein [Pedobacter boryungensis]|uniref:Acyltransferase n=2 Tax=Pedobacter boryungensis TaxID=869962 RepID=A0ABX2D7Z3_9SPHI|nr:acyltransferase [Pedobacter boryungensis]NQX30178.1 acyltransferase [Pedobacter boryungensis]
MQENHKGFIQSIQFLRGFAALAVVLCHYGSSLVGYKNLSKVLNYGQYGVHVFFFVSGYVICLALIKNNYHPKYFFNFLLKRSIRIDPAYLTTIILTLLSFWLFTAIPSFKGNSIPFIPAQFLAHVFYIVPFTNFGFYNHVFWTLCVEFQFYILIGSLYFLNTNLYYRICFLMLFSVTPFIPFANSGYLVTTYSPIFAIGIATMHYHLTKEKKYLIPIVFSAVSIFLNFNIGILLLIVGVAIFVSFIKKISKIFDFLGTISYSLYIIHPLVLIYLLGIYKKLSIPKNLELLTLTSQLLIAIICAYIFYILIEKPSITLSKKIAYKNK